MSFARRASIAISASGPSCPLDSWIVDWKGRTMTGARKFLRYCTHSSVAAMRVWSTSQRVAASVNAGSSVPMSAGSARPMSFSWMTNSLPVPSPRLPGGWSTPDT